MATSGIELVGGAVQRFAAFSDAGVGGNPAGVLLDADALADGEMQQIATDIGFSETAFVTGPIEQGGQPISVRFFSPAGEVDFCGHATIATAVAIGELGGFGGYRVDTKVGIVEVKAARDGDAVMGTLRSPEIGCTPLDEVLLDQLLASLGWSSSDLAAGLPPAIGLAGNRHPVVVATDLHRLATLAYDFETLQRLCRSQDWVTVQLVVETGVGSWRSRNPFPWGGVVEDPATGAAAAALAGYLRALGRAAVGDSFVIYQGVEMGRPSRIEVEVGERSALISGRVDRIPD